MRKPSAEAWLTACASAASEIRALVAGTPSGRRGDSAGVLGAGGDVSLTLDVEAERIALAELSRVASHYASNAWAESEEAGRLPLSCGGSGPNHVVSIDPIDGSTNVRASIPFAALSIAVASSDRMRDVELAFVADLFREVEYFAWRDQSGAFTVSKTLSTQTPRRTSAEVLAVEHAPPDLLSELAASLPPTIRYVRVLGASALSLALVAAGGLDAVVAAKPIRPCDVAAGQLLVTATGGSVYLGPNDASLSAHERLPLVAAGRRDWVEALLASGGVLANTSVELGGPN